MRNIREEEKKLKHQLIAADIPTTPDTYIRTLTLLAGLIAFISFVIINYLGEELSISMAIALIAFGVSYIIGKRIPSVLAKARAEKIESDLPVVLRLIGIQLNMRLPFEIALENIAKWNFQCSKEFARAIDEISHGASIPEALQMIGNRVDSTIVKRSIAQLVRAYEEGTGGDVLKKLADELINTQKLRLRAFSAQMSFLGLVFIALASIAPTLYLVYAMIAALYLGATITPTEITLMFLIVFPVIVSIVILYLLLRTPRLMTGSDKFMSEKERLLLHTELERTGIVLPLKKFFLYLIIFSIILFCIVFIFLPTSFPYNITILFLPIFVYFILLYKIEARAKEIEEYLPDALFQVAAFEKGVPIERIIENIARSDYHSLSEEFSIASQQIESGMSVTKALSTITKRCSSKLLERVISLLNQCYRIGKDTQIAVRETAEDIFEMLMLIKEQAALLAIQRYTILIGGCILIPIILAFVITIISSLGYQGGVGFSKITESERQLLIETSTTVVQYYLTFYVLIASIFISYQEGKTRKFIIYFLIFLLISLSLFNFTKFYIKF
jgi:pilus assembly protein TadC